MKELEQERLEQEKRMTILLALIFVFFIIIMAIFFALNNI